jgi:glutamate-5-semialdehyde dehydrogenase
VLARSSGAAREAALRAVAAGLAENAAVILSANTDDVAHAREAALDEAFVDRLRVDEARLARIAAGVSAVASLGDPVGEVYDATVLPNGLRAHKQRVPLGAARVRIASA